MVLRTMKNCDSPLSHIAAALLGAAMATTLLTNEPFGSSLMPRMETRALSMCRVAKAYDCDYDCDCDYEST